MLIAAATCGLTFPSWHRKVAEAVEHESQQQAVPGRHELLPLAQRWWYLLRYHRPSQLVMRLVRSVHNRFARRLWHRRVERRPLDTPKLRSNAELAALALRKLADRSGRDESQAQAERVVHGQFSFLQHAIAMPEKVDWRMEKTQAAHLWRFYLHYQEYLLDLAGQAVCRSDDMWADKAWALVLDWIEANRLDDRRVLGDAWHPYCISRRLPVWIYLWLAAPPCREAQPAVLGSMLGQARYLEHHLEWDLRGNHLLENLRALAIAGVFFEGPDARRWLRKVAGWLPGQLDEQVLPHGEHFERSPGYHVDMLEAVLDLRDSLAGVLPDLARRCGETAARMAGFLRAILHPDGNIPLLGDSCLHEGEPLSHLLERAGTEDTMALPCPGAGSLCSTDGTRRVPTTVKPPAPGNGIAPSSAEPDGGRTFGDYWVYRHADDFLLFDAGPVGADHLPAHAHADLLTLEASVAGRRLIVDSGVFSYDDEPVRRYCRSTAAHNVLQVDGVDQCDLWSRFRMGYRGWPARLQSGREHDFAWARASHNAYRRLGVPQVGRWLGCRPGGPWLCVDWVHGHGRHGLTSWLHFHPEVHTRLVGDGVVHLERKGQRIELSWLAPGLVTVEQGWYCPRLGRKERGPTVRWETEGPLPTICGWYLTWEGCRGEASLAVAASEEPRLRWTEGGTTSEFSLQFARPAGR